MKPGARALLILAFALGGRAGVRAEPTTAVDVVVDFTPAGRKLDRPALGKPVYYYPLLGGYQALGASAAGDDPAPPPLEVAHLVAVELARQGYLATRAVSEGGHLVLAPPPTLVIAVHWGRLHPVIDAPADPAVGGGRYFNENQMLALVGGDSIQDLLLGFGREQIMHEAEQNRYFVVVTAFDYHAARKSHQRVQLWQAKMSVPTNGVTLTEVLPAMVRAGGPLFGRETKRPQTLFVPLAPEGSVEIGTPTVTDGPAAPKPGAKPAPVP